MATKDIYGPQPIGQIFDHLALGAPGGRDVLVRATQAEQGRRTEVVHTVANVALQVAREDLVDIHKTRQEGHQIDPAEVAAAQQTLLAATVRQRSLAQDEQ